MQQEWAVMKFDYDKFLFMYESEAFKPLNESAEENGGI